MRSFVLCKTQVPWLCTRSQPGVKGRYKGCRGYFVHFLFIFFFFFFFALRTFPASEDLLSTYIVCATPPTVLHELFRNFVGFFPVVCIYVSDLFSSLLYCYFSSTVNIYGMSIWSVNHTFPRQLRPSKRLISTSCTYFRQ